MWVNRYLRGELDFELDKEEKSILKELSDATNQTIGEMNLYRSVDAKAVFNNITDSEYEALQSTMLYGDNQKHTVKLAQSALSKLKKDGEEKGFMSTTRDRSVAENWGDFSGARNPVILNINTSKKTKGVKIPKHMDVQGSEQREVLLHKGAKYNIKRVYAKNGHIYVDMNIS